jgi:hypothetical protein
VVVEDMNMIQLVIEQCIKYHIEPHPEVGVGVKIFGIPTSEVVLEFFAKCLAKNHTTKFTTSANSEEDEN